ncbi:MAG TPA: hypothetical protein VL069_12580 [Opitutus sp.]|nr:hypothetical protein [Opitutus sp.]
MRNTKQRLRSELPRLYSQDLINNLFRHPYTKIDFIERDLGVSRQTASKYLTDLCAAGFVRKLKLGRTNFYINEPLFKLLSSWSHERSRNGELGIAIDQHVIGDVGFGAQGWINALRARFWGDDELRARSRKGGARRRVSRQR